MPFDDESHDHGGGNGGGHDCYGRLGEARSTAMVADVVETINAMCGRMAEHWEVCPSCSLYVALNTLTNIVHKHGGMDFEDVLDVYSRVFNDTFDKEGVVMTAFVVDVEEGK